MPRPDRMTRPGYNPRQAHKAARKALKARIATRGLPCAICGKPIDYSLPQGHPYCYELDEKIPLSLIHPSMRERAALDPENVQPTHRICNERRGNALTSEPRTKRVKAVECSSDWLS